VSNRQIASELVLAERTIAANGLPTEAPR